MSGVLNGKVVVVTGASSGLGPWDGGYSFSLNSERQPIDPYHEFRHLQVRGRLLQPGGCRPTWRRSRCCLRKLEAPQRTKLEPIALGSLNASPDAMLGNIGIPWDALTPILQMLIADRFKFVLMRGTRFRHLAAKLNSLRPEAKLTDGRSVACRPGRPILGFARSGEDGSRWRRARHRHSALGRCGPERLTALRIVPLGEVEQPPSGERVGLLGDGPNPTGET